MSRSVEAPVRLLDFTSRTLVLHFATAIPCCDSLRKNESGKEVRLPSRFAITTRLLQWRESFASYVRRCSGGAEGIKTDHTRFIGTEGALTRLANRLRGGANGERRNDTTDRRATRGCQFVAALVACSHDWINQTSGGCRSGARVRTTENTNRRCKSRSPLGGIGYFRGDNRTDRTDRR